MNLARCVDLRRRSHLVNRNVEDLRMEGCPPNLSDPSGVEPLAYPLVRPCEGRHEWQGIESANLTICGYEQFDPVGVIL